MRSTAFVDFIVHGYHIKTGDRSGTFDEQTVLRTSSWLNYSSSARGSIIGNSYLDNTSISDCSIHNMLIRNMNISNKIIYDVMDIFTWVDSYHVIFKITDDKVIFQQDYSCYAKAYLDRDPATYIGQLDHHKDIIDVLWNCNKKKSQQFMLPIDGWIYKTI